jgi:hypothetical protein
MEERTMDIVDRLAPSGDAVLDYDRRHLALYAALLDAEDNEVGWREAAASLMRLDVGAVDAETCWRSHVERARWIVGDGLGIAIEAFNEHRPGVEVE